MAGARQEMGARCIEGLRARTDLDTALLARLMSDGLLLYRSNLGPVSGMHIVAGQSPSVGVDECPLQCLPACQSRWSSQLPRIRTSRDTTRERVSLVRSNGAGESSETPTVESVTTTPATVST